ncbi:unnamed protein product [Oikopleura dioica]|uniref:Inositol hexakisphosphate and diphosphoinositol-pentakisphosphate kinase n=1 Tax=Oikopleura dioica TaxID=34765 RepID=E4WYZ5_OIKDI|nr:unnamed protein product [Oikopleura dioica]
MGNIDLDGVEDVFEDEEDGPPPIKLGICAMAKKTKSKPMGEIIKRMLLFGFVKIEIFDENVILNDPVEEWPLCDVLISFHSKGFPLEKAIEYAKMRNCICINDVEKQWDIQDRVQVYQTLKEAGIETPRYIVCDRSDCENLPEFEEHDDYIELNGEVFQKPFVEKPVSAENHRINIYYPSSAGGGHQKLFRKVLNRSSEYCTDSAVRKEGSYIYEDFMPTDGTDVKVYTVGPDYAHAEARKSPALDGKVERDKEGKEIRYPVILSAKEKAIARQVCLAFKQTVCGFDLLRANGKSYVCDVNGFSFVKTSQKYYDDCAKMLGNIILREKAPDWLSIPRGLQPELLESVQAGMTPSASTMLELRCVVAVIRHGDRTPKQKMKMEVSHPEFFNIFKKYNGPTLGKIKLKKPKELQQILDVARTLLSELQSGEHTEPIKEKMTKLEQLKVVLEMYGHFSGINRKIQLKSLGNKQPGALQLILKWGGELTPAGKVQAEQLGRAFRCMYPGGQGDYAGFPGCGLLRLHSTYRHDLKIYASDEGRVQMTAAAFAKGLLALEGELAPILVQMVKSANTNGLLDNESDELHKYSGEVKKRLHDMLRSDDDPSSDEFVDQMIPTDSISMKNSLSKMAATPLAWLHKLHGLVENLIVYIEELSEEHEKSGEKLKLYQGEDISLMLERWRKLQRDFKHHKTGEFDVSKIPDIYDSIKYDAQHNVARLKSPIMDELYETSKIVADIVIPQEYGIEEHEKLNISHGYCVPLLRKVLADLRANIDNPEEQLTKLDPSFVSDVLSPGRHVRTRLYFTSESHIHSLLTLIRYGGLCNADDTQWQRALDYISRVSELNYMTQIVIMLYEDPTKPADSDERYHIELHFSPGAKSHKDDANFPAGGGFRPVSKPNSRDEVERYHQLISTEAKRVKKLRSLSLSRDSRSFSYSPQLLVSPPETQDCSPTDPSPSVPLPEMCRLFQKPPLRKTRSSCSWRGLESRSRDLCGSPTFPTEPEEKVAESERTTASDEDLADISNEKVRRFLKTSKKYKSAPHPSSNEEQTKASPIARRTAGLESNMSSTRFPLAENILRLRLQGNVEGRNK